ncbi:VanW family protein [Desulfosporosinus youngiae]|uniref:Putative vancomycin resistance protein n=1 Tax=Desulfosporosinus youngiae DSM 17734 TaxID=768710 RepID=H5XTY6_9FIRM|nr:VanW family protein [Desulfosporosinus youngiae]EHQ88944.1 putative vancomycin resistance protein [Desulfosporosinus youngiae DSM 17734]
MLADTARRLLSEVHPIFYFLSVWFRRLITYLKWSFEGKTFSSLKSTEKLPYRVKKHQSVLIRKLGDTDMQLQYNKVKNLSIAIERIDGIIIPPGETFSFCKLVGLTTKRKGYLPGILLSCGEAKPGIGGGICQIANLIHWLVIHSPLTVTKRYHHSFDPFPDDRRVLPFGSGATVFYNYIDYQFMNCTPYTFQLRLWLSEKCLEGELRVDQDLDFAYHVFEKNHQFLKIGNKYFRKNELWRNKIIRRKSGEILETELVTKNFAEVKYVPDVYKQTDEVIKNE